MALTGKVQGWIGGGVAGAVVIAAAGWFLLISPQFDDKADADQRLADAQTQNIVLQKRLDTLREKASHTDELKSELAQLYDAMPGQHDIEGFTRQLTAFAADAGVAITSISPSGPSLVTLPETEAPSTSAAPTPDAADDTSKATTTEETTPQPPEDTGPAGHLYSITVTVVTTGSMPGQRAFLAAIETEGARRALVTGTSFSPIVDNATGTGGAPGTGEGSGADSDAATEGDTGTGTGTGDPADTGAEPPPPPAPSATEGQWTLTTQLMVFVAPQSPGQEAQLLDQLGGNG